MAALLRDVIQQAAACRTASDEAAESAYAVRESACLAQADSLLKSGASAEACATALDQCQRLARLEADAVGARFYADCKVDTSMDPVVVGAAVAAGVAASATLVWLLIRRRTR
jgi:hypothetical protein